MREEREKGPRGVERAGDSEGSLRGERGRERVFAVVLNFYHTYSK